MEDSYHKIYNYLYEEYIDEFDIRLRRPYRINDRAYLLRVIKRTIDGTDDSKFLRPDAKYFLLINFYHLVVEPISENNSFIDNSTKNYDQLVDYVKLDIETIIKESRIRSRNNYNDKEISGHEIIKTIDQLWDKLKTMSLNVWG